jgi:hypothetical protein
MHHIKADTDRLYVKRKVVGIGLLHTEPTHKAEINDIAEYLNTKYKYQLLLKAMEAEIISTLVEKVWTHP